MSSTAEAGFRTAPNVLYCPHWHGTLSRNNEQCVYVCGLHAFRKETEILHSIQETAVSWN